MLKGFVRHDHLMKGLCLLQGGRSAVCCRACRSAKRSLPITIDIRSMVLQDFRNGCCQLHYTHMISISHVASRKNSLHEDDVEISSGFRTNSSQVRKYSKGHAHHDEYKVGR